VSAHRALRGLRFPIGRWSHGSSPLSSPAPLGLGPPCVAPRVPVHPVPTSPCIVCDTKTRCQQAFSRKCIVCNTPPFLGSLQEKTDRAPEQPWRRDKTTHGCKRAVLGRRT